MQLSGAYSRLLSSPSCASPTLCLLQKETSTHRDTLLEATCTSRTTAQSSMSSGPRPFSLRKVCYSFQFLPSQTLISVLSLPLNTTSPRFLLQLTCRSSVHLSRPQSSPLPSLPCIAPSKQPLQLLDLTPTTTLLTVSGVAELPLLFRLEYQTI